MVLKGRFFVEAFNFSAEYCRNFECSLFCIYLWFATVKGTNEFGNERCNEDNKCVCYCEPVEFCTVQEHSGYNLYQIRISFVYIYFCRKEIFVSSNSLFLFVLMLQGNYM